METLVSVVECLKGFVSVRGMEIVSWRVRVCKPKGYNMLWLERCEKMQQDLEDRRQQKYYGRTYLQNSIGCCLRIPVHVSPQPGFESGPGPHNLSTVLKCYFES